MQKFMQTVDKTAISYESRPSFRARRCRGENLSDQAEGDLLPAFSDRMGADTPVEFSGREPLAAVRDALQITRPGELF